jgi:hypothetical protein
VDHEIPKRWHGFQHDFEHIILETGWELRASAPQDEGIGEKGCRCNCFPPLFAGPTLRGLPARFPAPSVPARVAEKMQERLILNKPSRAPDRMGIASSLRLPHKGQARGIVREKLGIRFFTAGHTMMQISSMPARTASLTTRLRTERSVPCSSKRVCRGRLRCVLPAAVITAFLTCMPHQFPFGRSPRTTASRDGTSSSLCRAANHLRAIGPAAILIPLIVPDRVEVPLSQIGAECQVQHRLETESPHTALASGYAGTGRTAAY